MTLTSAQQSGWPTSRARLCALVILLQPHHWALEVAPAPLKGVCLTASYSGSEKVAPNNEREATESHDYQKMLGFTSSKDIKNHYKFYR